MGKTRAVAWSLDVRASSLTAARELFAARGYDGTSLQDVARVVGVSKQAVLHHFDSKDALRRAVLDELLQHWGAALPKLLLGTTGGFERFRTLFGELVRFFTDEPSWSRFVVRELLDRPAATQRVLREVVQPWIDGIAAYLREGQRSGVLRDDVDAEAWVLEMIQLALFAAAAHPVLAGAMSAHGERRLATELTRIARVSLFKDRPAKGTRR
ncbi:MAG: TetR/AcrR family transcriptional regulator [Myxococcota bacterium]